MVLAVRSLGSMASAPMLFVPRPRPIHCHFGSVVLSASSVRHTPPPAVPTHRRHRPCSSHNGEIASVETRPETLLSNAAVVERSTVSGPRLVHTGSRGSLPARYAKP